LSSVSDKLSRSLARSPSLSLSARALSELWRERCAEGGRRGRGRGGDQREGVVERERAREREREREKERERRIRTVACIDADAPPTSLYLSKP
jgi:hypothetical protein